MSKCFNLPERLPNFITPGGGQGWTGATTCAVGSTCVYSNPWYSQCLPGAATTSTTTAKPASSSTPSSTTKPNTSTTSRSGTTSTTTKPSTTTTSAAGGGTTVVASGNPFSGVALYANPYYASEISTLAIPSYTGAMATKAAAVAKVPTFVWL